MYLSPITQAVHKNAVRVYSAFIIVIWSLPLLILGSVVSVIKMMESSEIILPLDDGELSGYGNSRHPCGFAGRHLH